MLSTVLLGELPVFHHHAGGQPHDLSPRLGPPLSGHFFFDLVHQMSARGGARGGAFPSAHVSGAVVVSLVAWRHQRRLAYRPPPFTGRLPTAVVDRPLPLRARHACGRGPRDCRRGGVSICFGLLIHRAVRPPIRDVAVPWRRFQGRCRRQNFRATGARMTPCQT